MLLVPLVMVAALNNPRVVTTMAQVTAPLVEMVTTALVRTTPPAMEVELGTPMELAVVTMVSLLRDHGIRVRRPAVTTVVLLKHHGTRARRPAAAGKLQTLLPFCSDGIDLHSSLELWASFLRAVLGFTVFGHRWIW
jgi:hypothetical protein